MPGSNVCAPLSWGCGFSVRGLIWGRPAQSWSCPVCRVLNCAWLGAAACRALFCISLDGAGNSRIISSGTCADAGMDPITTSSTCEAAAAALGLSDKTAGTSAGTPQPEGCYWWLGKSLQFSTNSANKGKGAETSSGSNTMYPICASRGEYVTGAHLFRGARVRAN